MKSPLIISHRGANKIAPENTISAFKLGLEEGADGIELDVQLSKDGEIVVIHDETLNRTTDMKGYVSSYTYSELLKASAEAQFGSEYAEERIPLLSQVLDMLKGTGKLLNIELKNTKFLYPGLEGKVISMVRGYKYEELTLISSFNHNSLYICKKLMPEIKTGILYDNIIFRPWDYAKMLEADALHPHYHSVLFMDDTQLKFISDSRLMVNPYTVNDEADAQKLIEKGVSAIITDVPGKLKRLFIG